MIRLTQKDGGAVLLNLSQIAFVQESSQAQKWHGVNANVQKALDGQWVEVRETVDEIRHKIHELRKSENAQKETANAS